ncbi:hypothetical protein APX70_06116 [Pseudomonas syringae pv. maculicola]|uniref:Uncharacterized protein n=1 Tax=Pseudomonas syringae pv. maculicola TaxID=59511 RepID=A0A3M2TXQ1_PSEYM|nr:hypothetical protein APX70_06116 [Pseudomonas syringae pv. maculicola]
MNEIGASSLIDEAQLLDEDVTLFMGHRFRDPLLEDWADFGWIQHARIIDRQLSLLTLKMRPVVDHHRARTSVMSVRHGVKTMTQSQAWARSFLA